MEQLNSLYDLLGKYWGLGLTILGALGFVVEITPIKVYPLRWLGNRLNGDLRAEIKEVKNNTITNALAIDTIRMKDLRTRIIDFADKVSKGFCFSQQNFDDIFEAYDEYEELIKKHNFSNGKIEQDMEIIKNKYHHCRKSCNFTKIVARCEDTNLK